MNRNIKLVLEYDGSRFQGWQIQKTGQRTVQGTIQKCLRDILQENIKLVGSGRTDSGVHALGQVANFKTDSALPTIKIITALNARLPEDIAVVEVAEIDSKFHAQYSAKSKKYRYTILNRRERCALYRHYQLHYPYPINLARLRREARKLIGKKDFKSFQSSDPRSETSNNAKTSVRTIKTVAIKKKGDVIFIEIEADGFLYKMVRNIVGTLLAIASNQQPGLGITQLITAKKRPPGIKTAEALGLTLLNVRY